MPNGMAKCEVCPIAQFCKARASKTVLEYPKKAPKKQRKIEEKTVLVIQNGQEFAIHKRPSKGLLAGLYELPNQEGYLNREEILSYIKKTVPDSSSHCRGGRSKTYFFPCGMAYERIFY